MAPFKEEASMLDEFACDACGSPAVTYLDVPEEDAAVVCALRRSAATGISGAELNK